MRNFSKDIRFLPVSFQSSEHGTRSFCPRCGTPLTFASSKLPDEIDVTICSLQDPERLPPKDHTRTSAKLRWVNVGGTENLLDRFRGFGLIVLRQRLDRFGGGNATTDDLQEVAEEVSGLDLEAFFDLSEGGLAVAAAEMAQQHGVTHDHGRGGVGAD